LGETALEVAAWPETVEPGQSKESPERCTYVFRHGEALNNEIGLPNETSRCSPARSRLQGNRMRREGSAPS